MNKTCPKDTVLPYEQDPPKGHSLSHPTQLGRASVDLCGLQTQLSLSPASKSVDPNLGRALLSCNRHIFRNFFDFHGNASLSTILLILAN